MPINCWIFQIINILIIIFFVTYQQKDFEFNISLCDILTYYCLYIFETNYEGWNH